MLVATTSYAADDVRKDAATRLTQERERVVNLLPQLRDLEKTKSKDVEVQVGLAILYREYDGSEDHAQRLNAQYARVLELDPNNKVIWQMRAIDAWGRPFRTRMHLVDDLEMLISNAKSRGVGRIYIRTPSPTYEPNSTNRFTVSLYDVFGDRSGRSIPIEEKDYDQARAKARQRVNSEFELAVNEVKEAGKHDPQNAYYDYLTAELWFNRGEPDRAVQDLEVAVRKPFIQRYLDQKEKAVAKALEATGAPPDLYSYTDHRNSVGNYVRESIWAKHVKPLITKMEGDSDFDQAKEICRLSVGIAKQIREEPLPDDSSNKKAVSEGIERWANERSAAIEKRKADPSRSPENTPQ